MGESTPPCGTPDLNWRFVDEWFLNVVYAMRPLCSLRCILVWCVVCSLYEFVYECVYRNYSCISRTFLYQFHTQKLGMRLIFEVQLFSGLITNCNHKLSSRWSHINAATSGMGGSVW